MLQKPPAYVSDRNKAVEKKRKRKKKKNQKSFFYGKKKRKKEKKRKSHFNVLIILSLAFIQCI